MADSRQKGAAFERAIINAIKDRLGDKLLEMPKRNLSQYQIKGEADILIPGWSIECKAHANTGGVYKQGWWQQAIDAAANTDRFPVLIYKFNNRPVRCVLQLMAVCRNFSYNPDLICEMSLDTWLHIAQESLGVDR